MKGASLLLFTFESLEVIESALSGDVALELLGQVVAHPGSICSVRIEKKTMSATCSERVEACR